MKSKELFSTFPNKEWLDKNGLTLTKKQLDSFTSEVYFVYADKLNRGQPRDIEKIRQQAYEKVTK